MQKEKRRPSLEELTGNPDLILLELSHVAVEAETRGMSDLAIEADEAFTSPRLTAQKVVALREKLQRASGSTNPGCLSRMAENMEVKS